MALSQEYLTCTIALRPVVSFLWFFFYIKKTNNPTACSTFSTSLVFFFHLLYLHSGQNENSALSGYVSPSRHKDSVHQCEQVRSLTISTLDINVPSRDGFMGAFCHIIIA